MRRWNERTDQGTEDNVSGTTCLLGRKRTHEMFVRPIGSSNDWYNSDLYFYLPFDNERSVS
jgi:hypothetical protein